MPFIAIGFTPLSLSRRVSLWNVPGLGFAAPNVFFIVPQRARDLGNSICVWESKVLAMLPERQGEAYLCVSKGLGDLVLRHKSNQTSDVSWPRERSCGQSPLSWRSDENNSQQCSLGHLHIKFYVILSVMYVCRCYSQLHFANG